MGGYGDLDASPNRADLKSGAVVREVVGSVRIGKVYRDQKLRVSWVTVVHVAYLGEIELVPLVWTIGLHGISLIQVIDAVTERVGCARQLPGEHMRAFEGICDDCWIVTCS